ncbi:MAG TPA: PEGA domain-containing protein [Vicinamibacterales bacterium]|nr:PEGA domain-containing protein [Vicinamibacterales bacterium]
MAPRPHPALLPGHSDPLGHREASFEPGSDSCREVLRFRPMFAESPAFESALRARVEALRHLEHPSLVTARFVERTAGGLILESRVPTGRRLVDVIGPHNGWTFALGVVRDVLRALVALNEVDGAVHGALSADRIVVTRQGRYVVTEHVLATALESLHLSRADFHALGIVVPDDVERLEFTHWTDLMQLGYLTLSLLLARPLAPRDFPSRVPDWLDEFAAGAGSPAAARKVRGWIERATQVRGATPFASVRNAQIALDELSEDVSVQGAESAGALLAFASESEDEELEPAARPARSEVGARLIEPAPIVKSEPAPAPVLIVKAEPPPAPAPVLKVEPPPPVRAAEPLPPPAPVVPPRKEPAPAPPPAERSPARRLNVIIGIVGALVIAEGVAIGGLMYLKPATPTEAVEPRPADLSVAAALPPASSSWETGRADVPVPSQPARPASPTPAPPAAVSKPVPAAGPHVGGLTVTSAVELQVFKDGVRIGSTAAPLAVSDGRYALDFVNDALGFRVSLPVAITSGRMNTLKVPVPNGRVSINAVPWAQVTIDGTDRGQTPIANLPLPIGSHEVVFTHPQYGERRQRVVVTVNGIARVTQSFR